MPNKKPKVKLDFGGIDTLLVIIGLSPSEFLKWLDVAYESGTCSPCYNHYRGFSIFSNYVEFEDGQVVHFSSAPTKNTILSFYGLWRAIVHKAFSYQDLRDQFVNHYKLDLDPKKKTAIEKLMNFFKRKT